MQWKAFLPAILIFSATVAKAQAQAPTALLLAPSDASLTAPLRSLTALPKLHHHNSQPPPQGVYGYRPGARMQAYIGYSFLRFYATPGAVANTSGVEGSLAYSLRSWIAAEGEINGQFGAQSTRVSFAGGGLRVCCIGLETKQIWAHAIVGGAHLIPTPTVGGSQAFGYEAGAGIDMKLHNEWPLVYRVEADVLGTSFFQTYQVSPRVSVGLVFNF